MLLNISETLTGNEALAPEGTEITHTNQIPV